MTEYKAGVCNINSTERKKRKVMGAVSFLNAMILTAVLFIFPSFTPLYAGIFFLSLTGFLGFLQSRHHFCAGLALREKFHIGEYDEEINDSELVAKDRKKAASLIIQSIIGSTLLTISVYLIIANF